MNVNKFWRCFGKGALYGAACGLTYAVILGGGLAGAAIANYATKFSVNPKNWKARVVVGGFYAGCTVGAYAGIKYISVPALEFLRTEYEDL